MQLFISVEKLFRAVPSLAKVATLVLENIDDNGHEDPVVAALNSQYEEKVAVDASLTLRT